MCGRLLRLGSPNVGDCEALKQTCDFQGTNSEEYDQYSFVNLQKLEVSECPNLKYLFAASVVAKEGVVSKTFYPSKRTVEGPILKKLELTHSGIHYTDDLIQQDLCPCLKDLTSTFPYDQLLGLSLFGGNGISWKGACDDLAGRGSKLSRLQALKFLGVQKDESVLPLGDINQRFQNLKKLTFSGYSCKEEIVYGEYQTQAASQKMKILVLQYLGDLNYIWKQDSPLDLIFQDFKVHNVVKCFDLINLMLPSASFQNLTILDVWNCESLETIVTSSMAKSLIQLEKMCISYCPNITEVIQNQGDVTENYFLQLEDLATQRSGQSHKYLLL